MSNYLEKLHTNQIRFPKAYDQFLRNLFYMVDSLKTEEEIRMNIYSGFEKYRDCVEDEHLNGIALTVQWKRDKSGYKEITYKAVIKPRVLLAQLDKYCVA